MNVYLVEFFKGLEFACQADYFFDFNNFFRRVVKLIRWHFWGYILILFFYIAEFVRKMQDRYGNVVFAYEIEAET